MTTTAMTLLGVSDAWSHAVHCGSPADPCITKSHSGDLEDKLENHSTHWGIRYLAYLVPAAI